MDTTTANVSFAIDLPVFVDWVRRSGVIAPDRFNAWLATARPATVPDAVTRLVSDRLVTGYQARAIVQGQGRRLTLKGKYRVLDELGGGGGGAVLLAEHLKMRKRLALKVLPARRGTDPAAVARFRREATALAALDHPNVIRVLDADEDDGLHFLVMEYAEGEDLDVLVRARGPLPVDQAVSLVAQAAAGLDHAHRAGWVHRDVKPANLLVAAGRVKVLDLGLARLFASDADDVTARHDPGAVVGTVDYIAPEQTLDSSGVDHRADVYALGATLYFLLAGRPPFPDGAPAQKLLARQVRDPVPVQHLRPDVPDWIAAVISRMMARDPAGRYSSLADVASDIQTGSPAPGAVPSVGPGEAAPPASHPAARGPGRLGLWAWAGGAVLASAALVVTAAQFGGRTPPQPPAGAVAKGQALPAPPAQAVAPVVLVQDGGFEMPPLPPGQSTLHPTGSPWTFGPRSGLVSAGPKLLVRVPEGKQMLFIRQDGTASQDVILTEGAYFATFVATRPHPSVQRFRVSLGGQPLGEFTPGKDLTSFTTAAVALKSGTYTVRIQGLSTRGWDDTGYLDEFRLVKE